MDGLDPPEGAGGRLRFTDPDELEAVFKVWGMEVSALSRETGEHWTAFASLEELRFWATRLTGRYRVRSGTPAGSVLVQLDLGGNISRRVRGTLLDGDDILVGFGRTELEGVLAGPHDGMSFVVPEQLVRDALAARMPDYEKVLRTSTLHILSRGTSSARAVRRFAAVAFDPTFQREAQNVRRFVSGDMLEALMNALISACEFEPTRTLVPHFQRLPIVHRVEDFMRANLGTRLMLDDLCRVARASQRTVEYAFSSVYGVGPKQYLRLLRLNEVRRTLRSVPPEAVTIKDIAHRYGFWHLGHFAAEYRRLFGETPEETRSLRYRLVLPSVHAARPDWRVQAHARLPVANDNEDSRPASPPRAEI
jgi:AraC family ethanolamine operon transcriptional activator